MILWIDKYWLHHVQPFFICQAKNRNDLLLFYPGQYQYIDGDYIILKRKKKSVAFVKNWHCKSRIQQTLLMQDIEPYYNWRHLYAAEEDDRSPFYGRTYSEFEFSQTVYNYYIHPQWDEFGSKTLYMKILFVDYEQGYAIIELMGEWNDAIENDIMMMRRDITDILFKEGITKFVLIAENVLNFHSSDDSYYEEWREQLEEEGGWVVIIDMPQQSQYDFKRTRLTNYIGLLDFPQWRTLKPELVFNQVDNWMMRQLK